MADKECPDIDECKENREEFKKDREEGIRFRAEVRGDLKHIIDGQKEAKETSIRHEGEIWDAVGDLRKTDKELAGGIGKLTAIISGIKGRTAGIAAAVATIVTVIAFLLGFGSLLVGGN